MDYKFVIESNFVDSYPFISPNEIRAFSIKQRQNGEYIGIVKVANGTQYVKSLFSYNPTQVTIPIFRNYLDRDLFIKNLYLAGYTQYDISIFMEISQSLVSRILKKLG